MKTKINFLTVITGVIFLFASIGCEKDHSDKINKCLTDYLDQKEKIKNAREESIERCKKSGGTPAGVEKCILDVNTQCDTLDNRNFRAYQDCEKNK